SAAPAELIPSAEGKPARRRMAESVGGSSCRPWRTLHVPFEKAVHKLKPEEAPLPEGESLQDESSGGRSSAGVAGLIVLPGVIDADYTGEIMVAVYTLNPPLIIPKGTRIAQLLIFKRQDPEVPLPSAVLDRGGQGFGSTGDTYKNSYKPDMFSHP
uniref:dUTPase-like domain-containing protein n=1 Tax=Nothoprocta perdicaria TaxID=30464 RepID=A0A8C6YU31_NOTPE